MNYLTEATDIQLLIDEFASAETLWLDTETADWFNPSKCRVSLIQVLAEPEDLTGDRVYILDVLDKPKLIAYFINKIMLDPNIQKVFHNASYDLRFLGKQAQNVTCTWKMAKKLPTNFLQVPNLKLKTLAAQLCHFSNIDREEQGSDWARRPLTEKQLRYAKMDPVYLAQVHLHLLKVIKQSKPVPVVNIIDSEYSSFSVTKVRVAFECPRLFYLNHSFGGHTVFLSTDKAIGIGKTFHQLADQFVSLAQREPRFRALFEPAVEQLKVEEVTSQMQQLFYELAFFPYLQVTTQVAPSKAPALLELWQGLKGLIQRWAELLVINRRYCPAEVVISQTFVLQERRIEHYFCLPDGKQQRVVGEFDSLVFNFELQRLCVVEFKTYQPVDPSAQLAQVALYSYMLWVKKKIPIDSAVYCILPEFQEYHYSWEQLKNTVHQLIPHKLQQMQQWLTWGPPSGFAVPYGGATAEGGEPLSCGGSPRLEKWRFPSAGKWRWKPSFRAVSPQPNPPPPTLQLHLCEICPQHEKCQTFFAKIQETQ